MVVSEEVKDTIVRKKARLKELCRFPSEENKIHYKRVKNQTWKVVAKAFLHAIHSLENCFAVLILAQIFVVIMTSFSNQLPVALTGNI